MARVELISREAGPLAGEQPAPPLPAPVEAMLGALSPAAKAELVRALHLRLFPKLNASQRRQTELGCLARLLAEHGTWPPGGDSSFYEPGGFAPTSASRRSRRRPRPPWPVVPRQFYDERRDSDAPSSEALMRTHRATWPIVCRVAAGLELDGRQLVSANAWLQPNRGRPGPRTRPKYTREEARAAIRQCAAAFGRDLAAPGAWVTTTVYCQWSAAQRRRARQLGQEPPRLPCWGTIRKLYGGWRRAVRSTISELQRGQKPPRPLPPAGRTGRSRPHSHESRPLVG